MPPRRAPVAAGTRARQPAPLPASLSEPRPQPRVCGAAEHRRMSAPDMARPEHVAEQRPVVAAVKASIDANPGFNPALTVPEQSRATHALMGERASQRRRNRTVVARNPFSRFAMRRLAFSLLAIVLIGVLPAFAQEAPPARVGRVSFVSGQLGFHLAGEPALSAARSMSRSMPATRQSSAGRRR